ncbi:MAG TPA: hypothetical protein VG755_38570 [Nannocystaceae bacterium]|nr:hypothetical protein [Nannocystaceae bacterium]
MFAVVIDRVTAAPEVAASALAKVLGKTAYEARPSVQLPGGGPAVVGVHATAEAAQQSAAAVRAAGFTCTVVPAKDPLPQLVVPQRFELGADELVLDGHGHVHATIRYDAIAALLHGVAERRTQSTENVTTRKLSLGRAALTGGLVNTRTQTTTRTTTTTDSDELLFVFAGADVVALREHELQYQSLGAALQPSRMANFRYLVGELQRRATRAVRDDRLMKRSVQTQMLGPVLRPEEHLELAAELVAASLCGRLV